MNFWTFWPHLAPAVTTDSSFSLLGSAPAPSPARGLRGPRYLTTAALLTHPTGQRRVISILPQRNTGRVRGTGGPGCPRSSSPHAGASLSPEQGWATSRAMPSTSRSPLAGSGPSGTLCRSLKPSRSRQTPAPALPSRSVPPSPAPPHKHDRGGVRKWAGKSTRFLVVQSAVNHHNPASHRGVPSCYSLGGDVTDASTPGPRSSACRVQRQHSR